MYQVGLNANCTLQKIGFLVETPGKQGGGVAIHDVKVL